MARPRRKNRHLPPKVRERHGSYHFIDDQGRSRKLCRVDEGEAKLYEELLKLKRAADRPHAMSEAISRFKLEHLPGLAVSTRAEHERILDIFAKVFDEFDILQVRPTDVTQVLKKKWPGKPTMQHHAKSRLSTFFRWCMDEGLRNDNPCRDLWVKGGAKHKSKWTHESFHAIRDALLPTLDESKWRRADGELRDDVRAGLMVQCYLDLSFLLYQRTTEIRRLRYSQVLERERLIHFEPTKTAKSSGAEIDIPITPALEAVLARVRSLAKIKPLPGGDAFVIQTRKGSPYTAFGIRSAINRAAIRAGYAAVKGPRSGLTAKDLRAFAASYAKAQGYTLEQLKAGLAHTTITTTEGYVQQHTTPVSEIVLSLPPRPRKSKNSGQ
jgi:integrase